jgi:xanthine dehydrogenase YagR molybdenum-binding subunit
MTTIGASVNRVAGKAPYTADHAVPGVTHAALVKSTVARGRIQSLDTAAAEKSPGVLAVLTHENVPKLYKPTIDFMAGSSAGESLLPLAGEEIHYAGQTVAMVVARTLEQARHAAGLVRATYEARPAVVTLEAGLPQADEPARGFGPLQIVRGADPHKGVGPLLDQAPVRIAATYETPIEHHSPMEPAATTAVWQGDRLTVYDTTQWMMSTRNIVADALGIPKERVTALCPFVGGGFGCKGTTWMHTVLVAAAARAVGHPVKLALTREQMFDSVGHRPRLLQEMSLGCDADGKLLALRHLSTLHTSKVGFFLEEAGARSSAMFYAVPALEVRHKVARLDLPAPIWMRAPGETPGMYALECAMDELAWAAGLDPVELRLRNHSDVDPDGGLAYSSKHLEECYARGAEAFGWARRAKQPASWRDGDWWVGQGMASATYPAMRFPASARVRLLADGTAHVSSATHDLGTGMYTILTQVTADALGLPIGKVHAEIGDSSLPPAPVSGGSMSTASVMPAAQAAAKAALRKLAEIAVADGASPLHRLDADALEAADGALHAKGDPGKADPFADILQRHGGAAVEATETSKPGDEGKRHAFSSWGAQFAEVRVHDLTGEVRVSRFVSAIDVGRVLNAKTARSQVIGGVVMGIGMALMEESLLDARTGRFTTANFADYRIPVHADIPPIEVHFVGEPDLAFNALGARGVGEIGITGVAAAIANAVYHATGKRIRDLPITPDKLL